MKFSGPQCRFVKLHRPPPEIRIFRPGCPLCSSRTTRFPRRPAVAAHINPAAPAPKTITSNWRSFGRIGSRLEYPLGQLLDSNVYRGESSAYNDLKKVNAIQACCINNGAEGQSILRDGERRWQPDW